MRVLLCLFGLMAMASCQKSRTDVIKYDKLAKLYLSLPGYIRMTQELLDQCWRCSSFDSSGFGIMPHTDPARCWSYIVCWKDDGVFRVAFEKDCAYGTIYHDSGPVGIPCDYGDPADVENCTAREEPTWESEDLPCPYYLMDQDDPPTDVTSFGIYINGVLTFVDDCGPGGRWDSSACACVKHDGNCKCMVQIDFEMDYQAHGCNGGWVTSEGTRVDISRPGRFGNGARFRGYRKHKKNGNHFKAWALDGTFDNACNQWEGYRQLSIGVWIKFQGESTGTYGVISYGDCGIDGPAFYISVVDNFVTAGLKTQGNSIVHLNDVAAVAHDTWVYIALVYDEPTLLLYVINDSSACLTGSTDCAPAASATQTGCVESRMCGMEIGFTGTNQNNEFFVGMIDEVEVFNGASFLGCP